MKRHSGKPVPVPDFLFHQYEIIKAGKPGEKDSATARVTGWCMDINTGDEIDIHLEPLMVITQITKRDHQGCFGEFDYDSERNPEGVLKGYFAYKPTEKNKNSYFEAICTFTPQIKTKQ